MVLTLEKRQILTANHFLMFGFSFEVAAKTALEFQCFLTSRRKKSNESRNQLPLVRRPFQTAQK